MTEDDLAYEHEIYKLCEESFSGQDRRDIREIIRRKSNGCHVAIKRENKVEILEWFRSEYPEATVFHKYWFIGEGREEVVNRFFTETPEQAFHIKMRWG